MNPQIIYHNGIRMVIVNNQPVIPHAYFPNPKFTPYSEAKENMLDLTPEIWESVCRRSVALLEAFVCYEKTAQD